MQFSCNLSGLQQRAILSHRGSERMMEMPGNLVLFVHEGIPCI